MGGSMETKIRSGRVVAVFLALALAACQGTPQLGQGGSVVTGSGGSAGTQGASMQLHRCSRPLGTAALVEPPGETSSSLQSLGLASPLPLMRLMMAQSNCFKVVDRGAAMKNVEQEEYLRQSGMLRGGSQTAKGRIVTASVRAHAERGVLEPERGRRVARDRRRRTDRRRRRRADRRRGRQHPDQGSAGGALPHATRRAANRSASRRARPR